ncbi:uncharacterized protein EI90DRAFT_3129327 [Cantharellus anzutake]|uniref:uncharacterized protein n=1 Tax=Cantharellus anzutake TaxID=1750568 RepID=UPI0019040362|nr:uncharacterized protein EI90DRAFT_3129327 [Cantharellus anzutake]KAF8325001.1 hypothetical protein EI90DRAFT_3129327 [Cantharellus anzutake]
MDHFRQAKTAILSIRGPPTPVHQSTSSKPSFAIPTVQAAVSTGAAIDSSLTPTVASIAPRTLNLTFGVLLPFHHLLLANFQEVIPPPALTPPLVRLQNIPGPTSSSTPSRQACNTYAPDSGTSSLSSNLGL